MSINCVLTSDRTQFKNYFQDGITIPANAAVALTKCAIDVPIFIQTVLRVPAILAGDRNDAFLTCTIDGIRQLITWTDFYNAVVTYPTPALFPNGVERDLTIDNFYSGDYEFFLNNRLFLSTDGQTVLIKPNFMWVLAKAINDKFEFYRCDDITEYTEDYCGINDDQSLTAAFGAGNVNYDFSYVRAIQPTEYKLNVAYETRFVRDKNFTDGAFAADDLLTWAVGGTGNRLTSVAGAAVNVGYGNAFDIDVNGGWCEVVPTLVATGVSAFGFSLEGNGDGATDKYLPKTYATMALASPVIDIGIQFEVSQVGGVDYNTYKIIDGQEQYVHYDGANHDVQNYSIFKPYDAVSQFTNANDKFVILVRRGNIINGNYEFVFDIKMGSGANINTYQTIYTSRKTLNNPNIQIVPVFLSNAVAGNIFNNIRYIQTGADTIAQGASFRDGRGDRLSTFSLGVAADNIVQESDVRDFINGMGLNYYSGSLNTLREPFNISYDGNVLNKVLSWDPAMNTYQDSNALVTYYWIGETRLQSIFRYNNATNSWAVNANAALTDLPKYLNIFLLNQTNKNYTGSFIGNANIASGTNEGEDRLIGTIALENTSFKSQILNINYETFNPYYRPLNNPNAYVTNEFIIEISFKDFRTDVKKFINDIDGLVKVEINLIKKPAQNLKRITGTNNLVPIV